MLSSVLICYLYCIVESIELSSLNTHVIRFTLQDAKVRPPNVIDLKSSDKTIDFSKWSNKDVNLFGQHSNLVTEERKDLHETEINSNKGNKQNSTILLKEIGLANPSKVYKDNGSSNERIPMKTFEIIAESLIDNTNKPDFNNQLKIIKNTPESVLNEERVEIQFPNVLNSFQIIPPTRTFSLKNEPLENVKADSTAILKHDQENLKHVGQFPTNNRDLNQANKNQQSFVNLQNNSISLDNKFLIRNQQSHNNAPSIYSQIPNRFISLIPKSKNYLPILSHMEKPVRNLMGNRDSSLLSQNSQDFISIQTVNTNNKSILFPNILPINKNNPEHLNTVLNNNLSEQQINLSKDYLPNLESNLPNHFQSNNANTVGITNILPINSKLLDKYKNSRVINDHTTRLESGDIVWASYIETPPLNYPNSNSFQPIITDPIKTAQMTNKPLKSDEQTIFVQLKDQSYQIVSPQGIQTIKEIHTITETVYIKEIVPTLTTINEPVVPTVTMTTYIEKIFFTDKTPSLNYGRIKDDLVKQSKLYNEAKSLPYETRFLPNEARSFPYEDEFVKHESNLEYSFLSKPKYYPDHLKENGASFRIDQYGQPQNLQSLKKWPRKFVIDENLWYNINRSKSAR